MYLDWRVDNRLESFQRRRQQFGVLNWDIELIIHSSSVNLLNMALAVNCNKIISRTYKKMMNSHLYVLSFSENPPNCMQYQDTVYSLIQ